MQKTAISLVALGCMVCFSLSYASSVAKVTALKSPAWIQKENDKTELTNGSDLEIGDYVITGTSGRVEMQIWPNASLHLYPDSVISLLASSSAESSATGKQSVLQILQGRICVGYKPEPNPDSVLEVNIGNAIVTAIHHRSDICLLRQDGLSSIELRSGSVQVTHSIDPNMIILSRAGTELRIDDDGSFELLNPGIAAIMPEAEQPFITETAIETEIPAFIPAEAEGDIAVVDETAADESEPTTDEKTSKYIYTVYLFSTRSEEVANEANQRFQSAGHESEIIVTGQDDTTRYRVAVPGFKSRQSAQEFSISVVGKLGIRDTWIGYEVDPDTARGVANNQSKPAADEKPFFSEKDIEDQRPVDESITMLEDVATTADTLIDESKPAIEEKSSNYIYTVYLFSTRSEEVANEVNQRFQSAGHESEIIVTGQDDDTRYRIAVSGFKSRQSAREFSDSVVGKLGIRDTWIGRDRQTD
ncbi:MAG: SPOR domain-containing protein [Gammaproteobacteria bacterium]|nr:SPOR domain-containing protein [Gammaproteobacteria bacterium]